MNWKRLFENHILARGYDYYCAGAVENLEVSEDFVSADVIGSDDYEVEISFDDNEVTEMYCSCPYAECGRNCKHMAAVLYEWFEFTDDEEAGAEETDEGNGHSESTKDLFGTVHTVKAYEQKLEAIRKVVDRADVDTIREYLTGILAEDEKLLVRFMSMVGMNSVEEDVQHYIR